MSKCCVKCGVEKSLEDFSPQQGQPMGRASYCRPCAAAYDRDRKANPEVRARNAAQTRARRRNPDVAERDRITSAAWKAANPEKALAHSSTPKKREQDRLRRQTEHGRRLSVLAAERRRARITAADDGFTPADWKQVLDYFGHCCAYCLRPGDGALQVEHMQPLSKGGRHSKENIVPACRSCNQRKNSRTLIDFAGFA